jgi:DnaK suppressor protein
MDKRGGAKRKRRERLRKMLMEKQRELEKRIAEQIGEKVSEDIKAKLGSTLDEGDLSSAEELRDVNFGILTMYSETLREIREAVDRLEKDIYGYCEECGQEIDRRRLEVMPFTRYCIDCQREHEKSRVSDQRRNWLQHRARIEQSREGEEEDTP